MLTNPLGIRVLIASLALAFCAPASLAEDGESLPPSFQLSSFDGKPVGPTQRRSRDADLIAGLPFTGLRAEAYPDRLLGLFWVGKGIRTASGGAVLGVEGGASLRLRERLHLVGSYRLVDWDVDLLAAGSVDRTTWGPFVGLDYRF